MIYIGLTGGVCCGKSLVAHYFEQLGTTTIDLDELAKQATQPNQIAYHKIVETFGKNILDNNNNIQRKILRQIIFNNPNAKKQLENIVLPALEQLEHNIVTKLDTNQQRIVITHGATIIETGWYRKYQKIIVVSAPPQTQLQRLIKRDNMDEMTATKMIEAQLSNDERERYANIVIQNNGNKQNLKTQVEEVYNKISTESEL